MICLGLGSNMGDREYNIKTALCFLNKHCKIHISKVSSLYETEPLGVKNQPEFLNAVVSIKTSLLPMELLTVCLDIEKQMGRVRDARWGPRPIDIDILIYDDCRHCSADLSIPHPRIAERKFVLLPLAEIVDNKDKIIFEGKSVKQLLDITDDNSNVILFKSLRWDSEVIT